MGSDQSRASDWGVGAMANSVRFSKAELLALKREFMRLAGREAEGGTTISRAAMRDALKIAGIHETGARAHRSATLPFHALSRPGARPPARPDGRADTEILDRLFTLFDSSGDERVNFRVSGVRKRMERCSPGAVRGVRPRAGVHRRRLHDPPRHVGGQAELCVARPRAPGLAVTRRRPAVSFELSDLEGDGRVSRAEMTRVLRAMNNTVDFFGDDPLPDGDVEAVVQQIFEQSDADGDGQLSYAEYMASVAKHPRLIAWIGRGAQPRAAYQPPTEAAVAVRLEPAAAAPASSSPSSSAAAAPPDEERAEPAAAGAGSAVAAAEPEAA